MRSSGDGRSPNNYQVPQLCRDRSSCAYPPTHTHCRFGVLDDGSALATQLEDRQIRQVVYLLHTRLESVHAAVAHVARCQR